MSFNKEDLKQFYQAKDYLSCINLLQKEIREIFIKKVQEKEPDFAYQTLPDLRKHCLKELSFDDIKTFIRFYSLSQEEQTETYELSELLAIYELVKE